MESVSRTSTPGVTPDADVTGDGVDEPDTPDADCTHADAAETARRAIGVQ
jgi:hypothetical protein